MGQRENNYKEYCDIVGRTVLTKEDGGNVVGDKISFMSFNFRLEAIRGNGKLKKKKIRTAHFLLFKLD